jgi:hypothetical protein
MDLLDSGPNGWALLLVIKFNELYLHTQFGRQNSLFGPVHGGLPMNGWIETRDITCADIIVL